MVKTDVFLFPFPLLFRPGAQALPPTIFVSELNTNSELHHGSPEVT